jgi:RimJ/RimL family protein N-acetyltransferase
VTIEPLGPAHAPALQALASDPAVLATTNLPSPYPPDGAEAFIRETTRRRQAGVEFVFAIIAGGRPIGCCGLKVVDGEPRMAELGYWLGQPFWGRGHATAAARQVLEYGFGRLDLERVTANCLLTNRASWRVLEKLGFRFTHEEPPRPDQRREPGDVLAFFELPREAWRG